jgi:ATP-dependent helicase YprA (DUF1998 family)
VDVFALRQHLIHEYAQYTRSFINIGYAELRGKVDAALDGGELWPEPLVQLNPSYMPGGDIDGLVATGKLHPECKRIFRRKVADPASGDPQQLTVNLPISLYTHQVEALARGTERKPFVVTTGTGSGKSLSYLLPVVDRVLRDGSGRGIRAIAVYPMNALANSQLEELEKFLQRGYPSGKPPVTFARYTGQEGHEERERVLESPPDVLLTNYVMLELLLTRRTERRLIDAASDLVFLILDELHTYRGRQGADIGMLVRRCRDAFSRERMVCIGTSATMASDGNRDARRNSIAKVGTRIFGQQVSASDVLDETLTRTTRKVGFDTESDRAALSRAVDRCAVGQTPSTFDDLAKDPLASWIEATFGLTTESDSDRLRRAKPRAIDGPLGACEELADLCGCAPAHASAAIRALLRAGADLRHPVTGLPAFAFRLHQFVTRGDTVWASLEAPGDWFTTLRQQQFVPGDRSRVLLPLVFCRDCGHHFYRVYRTADEAGRVTLAPRLHFRLESREEGEPEPGYLFQPEPGIDPWDDSEEGLVERLPPDWIEVVGERRKVKRSRRDDLPMRMSIAPSGRIEEGQRTFFFQPAPFAFCPACNVAYTARDKSDAGKLRTLGVDTRSTATTILALNAIENLQRSDLDAQAKKLLSFTDNRQDASLQAGHFNDFVEVGLVRSALAQAVQRSGRDGLRFGSLAGELFRALNLKFGSYSAVPSARFAAQRNVEDVFRRSLVFRAYRDLQRGWRVSSPNLEQVGLLQFEYESLDEFAAAEDIWAGTHVVLRRASSILRHQICRTLLDHLRRSLAIDAKELEREELSRLKRESDSYLREEWALDDAAEKLVVPIAWPRAQDDRDEEQFISLSAHSSFGNYLRRRSVLGTDGLTLDDTRQIIEDLFRILEGHYLHRVREPLPGSLVGGYRLRCDTMLWIAGTGIPASDHLREEQRGTEGRKANPYFVDLYRRFVDVGDALHAREHTAQVPAALRELREEQFRSAELPVLFCSPTMELGVDIAQLNVVNMRNVPPTPANYAQRSGRAGRGGQPALVYTYCSGFSPHDQYFFRRPERMVAGSVQAPRLDLGNEALVRAHIHAIWLGELGIDLGKTLADILVVGEEDLLVPLRPEVRQQLTNAPAAARAKEKARSLIDSSFGDVRPNWLGPDWIDRTIDSATQSLDNACQRWRDLYVTAVKQRTEQNRIIGDHGRSESERRQAKAFRQQAEAQIELLTKPHGVSEGDFYSYRYFASEGFLPGYSFPRLPVNCFVPGRRGEVGEHQYLNRPRFLAISEFGPGAFIYHEGARYRISRANIAMQADGRGPSLTPLKSCGECGYSHERALESVNNCERCGTPLDTDGSFSNLVRMQNVSAKRMERITSDEEERQRQGFEIRTFFRFAESGGRANTTSVAATDYMGPLAKLEYSDATTIWRVNLGWNRRANHRSHGFQLDIERGEWIAQDAATVTDGVGAEARANSRRVVPFVTDTKNALLFTPSVPTDQPAFMATLAAALKRGIQHVFQLEHTEIAVDALPVASRRNHLLIYEGSEGGAGVLRQIIDSQEVLHAVVRAALELSHFDPQTRKDLGARHRDGCEAGCYDCLLDYGNQLEHTLIDRKLVAEYLFRLLGCSYAESQRAKDVSDPWARLRSICDSELERRFLDMLQQRGYLPPDKGQYWIPERYTRPDFFFEGGTCVYIDGPPHDEPGKADEDRKIRERLVLDGYRWIAFHHAADWSAELARHPDVFRLAKS